MSSAVPNPPVNYQGNSKVDREIAAEQEPQKEERKVRKVEGVTVVKAKKSIGKRLKEGLGGGSDMQSVGSYLLWDVAIPAARDLVFDIIIEGARGSLYGDGRRSASSSPIGSNRSGIVGSSNTSRARTTNYNAISKGSTVATRSGDVIGNTRDQFDFSEWVIADRAKAEEIIESLAEAIDDFGLVSVAEFYELLQVDGNGFTDQKHGWNAEVFKGARARPVRGGFMLDLPQPRPFE
jgi:hypothetical protein